MDWRKAICELFHTFFTYRVASCGHPSICVRVFHNLSRGFSVRSRAHPFCNNPLIYFLPDEPRTKRRQNAGSGGLHHAPRSGWPRLDHRGLHLDFAKANLPPWFTLSGLMGMIGAAFLCWLYCKVYDQKARVPHGITNFLEVIVVFVRDEISVANLGREDGRKYAWLFLTQFTFILTLNFMGLIPLFTTATGGGGHRGVGVHHFRGDALSGH